MLYSTKKANMKEGGQFHSKTKALNNVTNFPNLPLTFLFFATPIEFVRVAITGRFALSLPDAVGSILSLSCNEALPAY